MTQSDALSQQPDLCPVNGDKTLPHTLLPPSLFICVVDQHLRTDLLSSLPTDSLWQQVTNALHSHTTLPIPSLYSDWSLLPDSALLFRGCCYVPDNVTLRCCIVSQYHDTLPAGHPGQLRTHMLVAQHFWWPGLAVFVQNYVRGCASCQQFKINCHPSAPSLQPLRSLAPQPFSLVTLDFIMDLPPSHGFDSILVMVDHGSTKGVILTPCTKMIDVKGTADILLMTLYRHFGLPDKLVSDRGPQFASHVFREVGRLLGFQTAMSTAYHPQTDGATE